MMKFPKIKALHHKDTHGIMIGEVYLSEKFDGSNGRLQTTEEGFMIGSRTREFTKRPENNKGKENTWIRFWDLITLKANKLRQWIPTTWVIFGELYGSLNHHTIAYPNVDFEFAVFDVFDEVANRFLRPEEWSHAVGMAGLTYIPHKKMHLTIDSLDHMLDQKDPEKDAFEGYVIKNYNSQYSRIESKRLYGKMYHPKVKTMSSKIFGRPSDVIIFRTEHALLQEWASVPRVVSVYHAGLDEGLVDGIRAMGWLIRRVWEDIIVEEIRDYILSDKFKGVDKSVPSTDDILKEIMDVVKDNEEPDVRAQVLKIVQEINKPPKGKVLHLDIGWMKRRLGGLVQFILKEYLLGEAVEAGEKLEQLG